MDTPLVPRFKRYWQVLASVLVGIWLLMVTVIDASALTSAERSGDNDSEISVNERTLQDQNVTSDFKNSAMEKSENDLQLVSPESAPSATNPPTANYSGRIGIASTVPNAGNSVKNNQERSNSVSEATLGSLEFKVEYATATYDKKTNSFVFQPVVQVRNNSDKNVTIDPGLIKVSNAVNVSDNDLESMEVSPKVPMILPVEARLVGSPSATTQIRYGSTVIWQGSPSFIGKP